MEINNVYLIKKKFFIHRNTVHIRHKYVQCVIIAVYYMYLYIFIYYKLPKNRNVTAKIRNYRPDCEAAVYHCFSWRNPRASVCLRLLHLFFQITNHYFM